MVYQGASAPCRSNNSKRCDPICISLHTSSHPSASALLWMQYSQCNAVSAMGQQLCPVPGCLPTDRTAVPDTLSSLLTQIEAKQSNNHSCQNRYIESCAQAGCRSCSCIRHHILIGCTPCTAGDIILSLPESLQYVIEVRKPLTTASVCSTLQGHCVDAFRLETYHLQQLQTPHRALSVESAWNYGPCCSCICNLLDATGQRSAQRQLAATGRHEEP